MAPVFLLAEERAQGVVGRQRYNRETHTHEPVPPGRTTTPNAAQARVDAIDESRWIARREERPELGSLRERLRLEGPRRYREGSFVNELDDLLLLACQAGYSATTLLRYRRAVFDAERLAERLAQNRAHFIRRWAQKAEAVGQPPDDPHSRLRSGSAEDTDAGPKRTPSKKSS